MKAESPEPIPRDAGARHARWVCEILPHRPRAATSGTSCRLHRARVFHYEVAHPHSTKQLLQVYRWHEQGYLLVLAAGAGDIVRAEPFDAVELDIARVFGWPGMAAGR
jgi:hypothetical protein